MDHSSSRFRVRYAETDQMGVVYHTHYLVWCEIGRTDFIRELGMSYAALERDGCFLAVAEASVRYLAPARYDDPILVRTRLEEARSRVLTFGYEILRDDVDPPARLATATTTLVSVSKGGTPRALPPKLSRRLRAAADDPAERA